MTPFSNLWTSYHWNFLANAEFYPEFKDCKTSNFSGFSHILILNDIENANFIGVIEDSASIK
jgi:hypothetical protein